MPNPLQSLLESQTRRTTPLVPAVIDRVTETAGVYYCTIVATGQQVRASVAVGGTTYQKRTPVILSRPDDGTVARTSGWVISKGGPAADYGFSAALPTSASKAHAGVSVSYLNPNAAVIAAGGTLTVEIYGSGLLSAAMTPGNAGIHVTYPGIRQDDHVSVLFTVDVGVAHGPYDLTVDANNVLRGFFIIT